jgi:hypothetical protein
MLFDRSPYEGLYEGPLEQTGRYRLCFLAFWRRERDSNPRGAVNPHTLSRRAT